MLQKPAGRRATPLTANLFHAAQSLFLISLLQDLLTIVSQFANSNKLFNKSHKFHFAQKKFQTDSGMQFVSKYSSQFHL